MNSKHLKGLAVISIADGEKLGTVERVLIDPVAHKVVGFAVRQGGGGLIPTPMDSTDEDYVDVDDIHALGQDAVTLDDKGKVRGDNTRAQGDKLVDLDDLSKLKVVTEGGTYIGDFASAEIDDRSLALNELEVSPGFFQSNRHLAIGQVVNIGQELIVVSDAVAAKESATGSTTDAGTTDSSGRRFVVGDA